MTGLLLACGGAGRSPSAAVGALDEAARDGDTARVMKLLGPRTRARLEVDARRAADQAGRRKVAPFELLAAGWSPARFELDAAVEISRSGETAVVEARGRRGERERVAVVRESGSWKVELP